MFRTLADKTRSDLILVKDVMIFFQLPDEEEGLMKELLVEFGEGDILV